MEIDSSPQFRKHLKKAPPNIRNTTQKRLIIFLNNPFHSLLNNHLLKGEYINCRSINITGDWRAIYKQTDENTALFIAIGTHNQLLSTLLK